MTIFFIFIIGLIIGSFLNAVIYRLHSGESVLFERSHCVHCHHELGILDLIPLISFIMLSGNCRYCGKKISWQYPIVEFLTALSFALFAYNYGLQLSDYQLWAGVVFIGFLVVVGVFDFLHFLILDKVVYPALALAVVWDLFLGKSYLISGLWGALAVAGFFAAQYYISKGRWIGFGDVKFGLFLGMLLGFKLSLVMLILAYFTGAIVGVALIASGKKTFSSKLPFGVFLSFATVVTLIYGPGIASWYFNLIGF